MKRERDKSLFLPPAHFHDLDFLARVLRARRYWDGKTDIEAHNRSKNRRVGRVTAYGKLRFVQQNAACCYKGNVSVGHLRRTF
jgi:hypothetical protein